MPELDRVRLTCSARRSNRCTSPNSELETESVRSKKGISFEELQNQMPLQELKPWDKFELEFESLKFFLKLKSQSNIRLRKMFGGLAIYQGPSLLLVLVEDQKEKSWKGKVFSFPLWHGILIATSREYHEKLQILSKYLLPHPVLGKWLYLPRGSPGWDKVCQKIVSKILRRSPYIGVKSKKKSD